MVSIFDSTKFSRLLHPAGQQPKKLSTSSINKYYKVREESAIKLAEEHGYFLDPCDDFLVSRFVKGFTSTSSFRWKKGPDLRHIEWVNLTSMHVRYLGDIPLCHNLCICILGDNYLSKIDDLVSCINLVKLDLHGNQISQLPPAYFWNTMQHLQILYLHDNPIGRFDTINSLAACPRLIALTLHNTPVSLRPNYRHHVVNSFTTLKALDAYMISDEEIIEDATFNKGRFSAYHQSQYICLAKNFSRDHLSYERELNITLTLLADINTKHAHGSPVLIIQKFMRGHLTRKYLRFSSAYRRFATTHRSAEQDRKLKTGEERPRSRAPSATLSQQVIKQYTSGRRRLVINLAQLHHETQEHLDKDAECIGNFMKKSTTLRKIPMVNPKRRKKKERVLKKPVLIDVQDFFGPVVKEKPIVDIDYEDDCIPIVNYRLQGCKHGLSKVDKTAEMLYTNRDIADDIRTEEAYFHEMRNNAPPPPKKYNKVNKMNVRIMEKTQRTMNLAPLRAIQKAYDDRQAAEKMAEKVEHRVYMKEQREHGLNQVFKRRQEHRQVTIHDRQTDKWNLQDSMDRNSTKRDNYLVKSRENRSESVNVLSAHKHERTFCKEFVSQHASVSNSLQRHDHVMSNQQTQTSQHTETQDRKQFEEDKQEMVRKYMEQRTALMQHEGSDMKSEINTRVFEDANDRMLKAKMRVERLKSMTKTIEHYHRTNTVLQLDRDIEPKMTRFNTVIAKIGVRH